MEPAQSPELLQAVLEWKVTELGQLFRASEGEAKSQAVRSDKFGDGKWQIIFYANSGRDGVSVYLACEPSPEEINAASEGKWVREGKYRFRIEIRPPDSPDAIIQKEAREHTFNHKTGNWGWNQFARREDVYYNSDTVKDADMFVILCEVTAETENANPS